MIYREDSQLASLDTVVTVKELELMYDLHPMTIYRYLESGRIIGIKVSGQWIISTESALETLGQSKISFESARQSLRQI